MTDTLTPTAPERLHAVASLTGDQLSFHHTPGEMFDRLAAVFGEQRPTDNPDSTTRWVSVGCGSHVLTFFADRD